MSCLSAIIPGFYLTDVASNGDPANIDERLGTAAGGCHTGGLTAVQVQDIHSRDDAFYRVKVWQEKTSNPLGTTYKDVPYEQAWSSPIWVEKQ